MTASKRFKILCWIVITYYLVESIFLWQTLILLPVSILLLFFIKTIDARLENLEIDHDAKIKELVTAENLTRKYVTKLTDQSKLLTSKLTAYENSTGKINRKLHRSIGDRLRVDHERNKEINKGIRSNDGKSD